MAFVDYVACDLKLSKPIKVEQDSSSDAASNDRGREAASTRPKKGFCGFYDPRHENCSDIALAILSEIRWKVLSNKAQYK